MLQALFFRLSRFSHPASAEGKAWLTLMCPWLYGILADPRTQNKTQFLFTHLFRNPVMWVTCRQRGLESVETWGSVEISALVSTTPCQATPHKNYSGHINSRFLAFSPTTKGTKTQAEGLRLVVALVRTLASMSTAGGSEQHGTPSGFLQLELYLAATRPLPSPPDSTTGRVD